LARERIRDPDRGLASAARSALDLDYVPFLPADDGLTEKSLPPIESLMREADMRLVEQQEEPAAS